MAGTLMTYRTMAPMYYHFRRWTENGTLEQMHTDVRRMLRRRYGRDPRPESRDCGQPSVKTTESGGHAG